MGANKYLDRPLTRVRRKDRVLDDEEWIDRFLYTAPLGHIAFCWKDQPLLHSNLFWFDGRSIYWHTAAVGKLRAVLDTGPLPACISVTEQGRILPAGTPLDFSTEYASVTLYGTLRVVSDPDEKRRGLEGLMTKYAPQLTAGKDYIPMPDSDVQQTSVYRFDIESRVAKHNVKPPDYPAYAYPEEPFIEQERRAERYTMRAKELA
jgi:nitroimidazol reductase NimA-like FMN-containing flavoprotein (pyridoxamine 5'-phosphate oxidase superfamily)